MTFENSGRRWHTALFLLGGLSLSCQSDDSGANGTTSASASNSVVPNPSGTLSAPNTTSPTASSASTAPPNLPVSTPENSAPQNTAPENSATNPTPVGGAGNGGTNTGGAPDETTALGGAGSGGQEPSSLPEGGGSGAAGDSSTQTAGTAGVGGTPSEVPQGTAYVFTVSTDGVLRAYEMNEDDGALSFLTETNVADGGDHFLAANAGSRTLFVAADSTVLALDFDPAGPAFSMLDEQTTFGGGTQVAVDPSGTHVVVAHYNEGAATHVTFDGATFGGALELVPGQNAHSANFHPSEPWVYIPCLGEDHVAQYDVDATTLLNPDSPATFDVSGGPRHMTFHPNGQLAYVLGELSGELHVRAVDALTGALDTELDLETIGSGGGERSASDVQITPNGEHLYAVERDTTSLYHFTVTPDGTLTAAGDPTDLGAVVRAFGMDPKGRWLQVGDANGNVRAYRINEADGSLTAGDAQSGLGNVHTTLIRYL